MSASSRHRRPTRVHRLRARIIPAPARPTACHKLHWTLGGALVVGYEANGGSKLPLSAILHLPSSISSLLQLHRVVLFAVTDALGWLSGLFSPCFPHALGTHSPRNPPAIASQSTRFPLPWGQLPAGFLTFMRPPARRATQSSAERPVNKPRKSLAHRDLLHDPRPAGTARDITHLRQTGTQPPSPGSFNSPPARLENGQIHPQRPPTISEPAPLSGTIRTAIQHIPIRLADFKLARVPRCRFANLQNPLTPAAVPPLLLARCKPSQNAMQCFSPNINPGQLAEPYMHAPPIQT